MGRSNTSRKAILNVCAIFTLFQVCELWGQYMNNEFRLEVKC